MTIREARCACGALGARRGRSGPAFGLPLPRLQAPHRQRLQLERDLSRRPVSLSGAFKTFTRGSDDGFWVRQNFCAECGVTICYEIERRPNMISIPAGTFADPDFPPPTIEVYDERRCPWLPDFGIPREF